MVVERAQPRRQIFWITGVGGNSVNVRPGVGQGVSEIAEPVGAPSQQGHSIAAGGETPSHGHSETRPRTDEQQAAVVD